MRKLGVLTGAVLALGIATSAFAATVPSNATAATPAAQHWAATATADTLKVRARLFATANYSVGWLEVQVRGLKAGAKVEVVLGDKTASATILDVTRNVRGHSSVRAFLVHLNAQQLAALKTGVTAKDGLTITVTSGTTTATGTFAAKG